ncbi:MAG: GNAT family N-acetyltransferase [Acutalibacteraceae bacterium]
MPDMLVRLYDLDRYDDGKAALEAENIRIVAAMAPNLTAIRQWIEDHFSRGWADEATKAILASPSKCFLAVRDGAILGFACYDATAKGFFGPTGVDDSLRKKGIGKALLMHTLREMYYHGYPYGVIGGVGPVEFYARCCGATLIDRSDPGYYRNML